MALRAKKKARPNNDNLRKKVNRANLVKISTLEKHDQHALRRTDMRGRQVAASRARPRVHCERIGLVWNTIDAINIHVACTYITQC